MNDPKRRVLMLLPTLGQRNDLLKITLDSVKSQNIALDIVMVFPFSNTATAKLAKQYGAMTVDDPGGISAALNAGLSKVQKHHDYVGWIGDDDLLSEHSLTTAIDSLDDSPESVVAYGQCDYIDDKGKKLFTNKAGKIAPWLMTWGPDLVPCPGALFRASSLLEVGGFDTTLKYAMDLDAFLKLRKIGKFIYVDRVQASFRWHPASTTVANRSKSSDEAEQVKRKHLPTNLQSLTPLWDYPVRIAARIAASRVNRLASQK